MYFCFYISMQCWKEKNYTDFHKIRNKHMNLSNTLFTLWHSKVKIQCRRQRESWMINKFCLNFNGDKTDTVLPFLRSEVCEYALANSWYRLLFINCGNKNVLVFLSLALLVWLVCFGYCPNLPLSKDERFLRRINSLFRSCRRISEDEVQERFCRDPPQALLGNHGSRLVHHIGQTGSVETYHFLTFIVYFVLTNLRD